MTSRRTHLWLLILATAIACQAGSVSTAHASCGDYLIGHHHGHARLMRVAESSFASEQGEWPFDAASLRTGAWSPDGERVAIAPQSGVVRLWTAKDGQPEDTLGAAS